MLDPLVHLAHFGKEKIGMGMAWRDNEVAKEENRTLGSKSWQINI